jgi:hypothetical protein
MPGDPDVDADTLLTRTGGGNRLEESEDGHRRVRQHCGAHRPSRPTPPPTAPAAADIISGTSGAIAETWQRILEEYGTPVAESESARPAQVTLVEGTAQPVVQEKPARI